MTTVKQDDFPVLKVETEVTREVFDEMINELSPEQLADIIQDYETNAQNWEVTFILFHQLATSLFNAADEFPDGLKDNDPTSIETSIHNIISDLYEVYVSKTHSSSEYDIGPGFEFMEQRTGRLYEVGQMAGSNADGESVYMCTTASSKVPLLLTVGEIEVHVDEGSYGVKVSH